MPMTMRLAPQLRVTTQMVLVSHLLGLANAAIEEAVTRELADNPALERAPVRRRRPRDGPDVFAADPFESVPATATVIDQLLDQARLLVPAADLELVGYLLYCLDEHGFLRTSSEALAQELGVSRERIEGAIAWLHQLEPAGVGARDLQECFRLQCLDLAARGVDCSALRRIIDEAWAAFVQQHWRQVARQTGLHVAEVHTAVNLMRERMYPYPLMLASDGPNSADLLPEPDMIIRYAPGDGAGAFSVEVPATYLAELRIRAAYQRAIRAAAPIGGATDPAAWQWLHQAVGRAHLFIDALGRRQAILQRLGEFLVAYQPDFLARGPRFLKPLTRRDAARSLGVHESTISRAVSDKIVQLPSGRLMELRALFDGSLAAKAAIFEMLASDAGTLSDREIAERLRLQSFDLSRRTVTQYREELGIPRMGLRSRDHPLSHRRP
ncbi:MAG: hypothetical protein KIS91_10650 [Anaerolineae bacterium]|nr:hypothetical protein [Anaerolineae bacterium]